MSDDPSGKDIRKLGIIVLAACSILGMGWSAKAYVDGITDNVLVHVDAIRDTTNEIKTTVTTHSSQIDSIKKYYLPRIDLERWGVQLEKGNRSVLNAAGVAGGLYVPPVPSANDQASTAPTDIKQPD